MRARTILDLPGRLDASPGIHSCPLSDKMFPRWALIQAQRGCYMSMFFSSFLVPPLVLLNCPNCLPAGLWTLDACHLVSLRQQDKTRWNTLTVPLTLFFQHRELLFFMRYMSKGFYRLGVTFWFLPLSPSRAFPPWMGLCHCCCWWCWCLKEHYSSKIVLLFLLLRSSSPVYTFLCRFEFLVLFSLSLQPSDLWAVFLLVLVHLQCFISVLCTKWRSIYFNPFSSSSYCCLEDLVSSFNSLQPLLSTC